MTVDRERVVDGDGADGDGAPMAERTTTRAVDSVRTLRTDGPPTPMGVPPGPVEAEVRPG